MMTYKMFEKRIIKERTYDQTISIRDMEIFVFGEIEKLIKPIKLYYGEKNSSNFVFKTYDYKTSDVKKLIKSNFPFVDMKSVKNHSYDFLNSKHVNTHTTYIKTDFELYETQKYMKHKNIENPDLNLIELLLKSGVDLDPRIDEDDFNWILQNKDIGLF